MECSLGRRDLDAVDGVVAKFLFVRTLFPSDEECEFVWRLLDLGASAAKWVAF